MPIEFYKLLHVAGLILVFLGLGGALIGAPLGDKDAKPPKLSTILHGIGLLAMLVAGFGMIARLEYEWPWPGWLFIKLGLWLVLGAMPVLVRKGVIPIAMGWLAAAAAGGAAVSLVMFKPGF